jgi:hypothetical protein
LYELLKRFPPWRISQTGVFHLEIFCFEQGELPAPLFDACTGTKTEWAFAFYGNFYACTATVQAGRKPGLFLSGD